MTNAAEVTAARQLAERRFEYPLVSAFLDLDPTRFATGVARATEINTLLDHAQQQLHARWPRAPRPDRPGTGHQAVSATTLTAELQPSGARGVAVYCSGRESLFEAIELAHPVASEIVIDTTPKLEPLRPAPEPACVCVMLVNRREARFFVTRAGAHHFEEHIHDDVRGQHRQGGLSEANYERSIEADVDAHLRHAAERLYELWRTEQFDRLVLAGPHELVTRFAAELHPDLRVVLDQAELALQVKTATAAEIAEALLPLRQRWCELAQWEALAAAARVDRRAQREPRSGYPARSRRWPRRQVGTLVLGPRADEQGGECPQCGQLFVSDDGSRCEADGNELRYVHSLRSAMIRSAVLQDAEVIVLDDYDDRPEIAAFSGIGAILRY